MGLEEFLERYAVILCADHGQTTVSDVARLQDAFPDDLVTASNRAGMVYTDADPGVLARRLDGNDSVDVVLWREGDEAVARRDGAELRFTPTGSVGTRRSRSPRGRERAWAALANPNAGELIVSAAAGWEFATSGAATTRAGARTARSSPATRKSDAHGRDRHAARLDRGGDARGARPFRRRASGIRALSSGREVEPGSRSVPPPTGISDPRVLEAIGRVPREHFVPKELRSRAYDDRALPIGHGQTISQPFMVAAICAALDLQGDERVLDVGTGSGYQAAVLAELADEVVTIERVAALAERARRTLAAAGYDRVEVRIGDGTLGVPERAPSTGSPSRRCSVRARDADAQLAPEGAALSCRLGSPRPAARDRDPGAARARGDVLQCRFVPLVGEAGFAEHPAW